MLQVPLCVFMSALSICMAWLILTCATIAVRAFGLLWILRRRLVLRHSVMITRIFTRTAATHIVSS